MIIKTEYGEFDITLCDKYKVTKYKDCILSSGVYDNHIYVREETHDDLEDVLDFRTDRKSLKIKAGTKIGIFNTGDEGDAEFGYRLDGEVLFTNDSILYHDVDRADLKGELSEWVVLLGEDKFINGAGEYSIITKDSSLDELNSFNSAINKEFDIIILSNS